jgi:hypothetical protein
MTEHDFSAEYHYDKKKDYFIELVKNDREPFITKHKRHKVEELKVNRSSYISDRPYSEPLKTSYFEVTDGREDFVIKRWRDKIESPLRYEIVEGYIDVTNKSVIHGENIRKQIQAEINPLISQDKITRLIQVVERVISELDPNILLKDSLELDHPLVLQCRLKNSVIKSIVELSKDIFKGEEFKKIRDFIYDNSDYTGVMAPMIKRQFAIKSPPQIGKRSEEEVIIPTEIGRGDILTL